MESDLVIDLFAGMGGWSVAAAAHGIHDIGIEHDRTACQTRRAAGHTAILADVASFPLDHLVGRVKGLIGSPPCPAFSMSGKRLGIAVMPLILAAIEGIFAGDPGPERVLHDECEDPTAVLVTEPARWTLALRPRWVVLEQVPQVLPIWNLMAHRLAEVGYSTWAGVLNSADYGVPQTRERAILIASLDRTVGPPPATHAKHPMPSLFGDELTPWVSMAQALGWGMTARPCTTVMCGHNGGGPDPLSGGAGSRRRLQTERDEGRWKFGDVAQAHGAIRDVDTEPAPTITSSADNGNFQFRVGFPRLDDIGDSPDGYRERDWREGDEPAFTVTEKARSWVVQTGNPTSSRARDYPAGERPDADDIQYRRDIAEPAPTLNTRGDLWKFLEEGGDPAELVVQTGNNSHVTSRTGSKAGEGGVELYERSVDEPAPTLDTHVGGKWRVQTRRGGDRIEESTDVDAPSPTITSRADRFQITPDIADGTDCPCDLIGAVWGAPNALHRNDDSGLCRWFRWRAGDDDDDLTPDEPWFHLRVTGVNTGRDWKAGGTREDAQIVPADQPAPTVDIAGRWHALLEQEPWMADRPATTVQGVDRVWPPGHKINGDDIRRLGQDEADARYGHRNASSAIRLGITDALILQSFDPDHPVQGNKSKQFEQVGNAIPPLLAWHVLAQVLA